MATSSTTQPPTTERISFRRHLICLHTCILLLGLTGCYSRVVNPEDFTIERGCTNCDTIRNDGMWIAEPGRYDPGPVILERDGTYLSIISGSGCNNAPSPLECHKSYVTNIETEQTRWGHSWGRWELRGDSIFVNFVAGNPGGEIVAPYMVYIRTGTVLNDSTIIMERHHRSYPQGHKRGVWVNDSTLYRFYQEDLDIPEENWIDTDSRFN